MYCTRNLLKFIVMERIITYNSPEITVLDRMKVVSVHAIRMKAAPERLSAEEKLRASILFQDVVHTKPN